mmetsp:Transcript_30308/g.66211  ORF Transcript_30308/g.66211 Transcript_30308/m.66211 type:complete len:303 (-) Transcript_30308:267-1175(-)|eukprot:CAMPEP_0118956660 /NCGR_PEP_ID=MMETSP1169-20130426/61697_1 /TAXON_ID=36882 /ORGANISM="Pyramimonas obovata, Strain CCMP722" /LENGTH=302 /DNA_ID=CAMNT_0006904703 /DNA_START=174 /DNA_END=1085 /DNA_ORIENTATION=-
MSDSEGEGPKVETRGQIVQRHKKEVKALKAQTAKMGKKKKDEIAAMEAELQAKHAAELAAHDAGGAAEGGAEESSSERATQGIENLNIGTAEDQESAGTGEFKMSKAQKRRAAKQKAEADREAEIELEKSQMGDSDRLLEEQAMKALLSGSRLCMRDVKADGHCMYRSLAMQLEGDSDYLKLRALCAQHLSQHADQFAAFAEGCEDDEEGFAKYCEKVESSAMWGGQLELQALSAALRRCIKVYSVGMPLIQFGDEFAGAGGPLHLAYLKHYFGLGEHYNAVLGASEAEAEGDEQAGGGAEA